MDASGSHLLPSLLQALRCRAPPSRPPSRVVAQGCWRDQFRRRVAPSLPSWWRQYFFVASDASGRGRWLRPVIGSPVTFVVAMCGSCPLGFGSFPCIIGQNNAIRSFPDDVRTSRLAWRTRSLPAPVFFFCYCCISLPTTGQISACLLAFPPPLLHGVCTHTPQRGTAPVAAATLILFFLLRDATSSSPSSVFFLFLFSSFPPRLSRCSLPCTTCWRGLGVCCIVDDPLRPLLSRRLLLLLQTHSMSELTCLLLFVLCLF